jgi:hypothetical protein
VTSIANTFKNGRGKGYGGFIGIENPISSTLAEFTDTSSTFYEGVGLYGGAISCRGCTKLIFTDSIF